MNNYIHFTHLDQLKGFPANGNFLAFSELHSFHAPMMRREVVGLKYVLKGEENYVVNGLRHRIKPGQLLVVDDLQRGEAFNGPETAVGICINIDKKMLNEVVANNIGEAQLDAPGTYLEEFNFFHSAVPATQLYLGKQLQQIAEQVRRNPAQPSYLEKDFFYSLAELMIRDHQQLSGLQTKVKASKKITQQEISKRLLFAKELMDVSFDQKLDLEQVALHAGMSEYHFCRSFKAVFGLSPYKYLLHQRLAAAKVLLSNERLSVSEVAVKCGFTDIFSFSKAFKKHFLISPSSFSRI